MNRTFENVIIVIAHHIKLITTNNNDNDNDK